MEVCALNKFISKLLMVQKTLMKSVMKLEIHLQSKLESAYTFFPCASKLAFFSSNAATSAEENIKPV